MEKLKVTELNKLVEKKAEETECVYTGTIGKREIKIIAKKYLTMTAFCKLVMDMAAVDFTENEDGAVQYAPWSSQVIFTVLLAKYYSNFPAYDDIEAEYNALTALGIYERILDYVSGTEQFSDLLAAIDARKKYDMIQNTGLNGLIGTLKNTFKPSDGSAYDT